MTGATARDDARYDYVLVGGGLQNGLIALALLARDPGARVLLVEQGEALGGNHTWSFHEGTIPAAMLGVLARLTEHRWPRYRVRFPGVARVVEHPYATVSSERFHAVVSEAFAAAPNARLQLATRALEVGAEHAVLEGGERVTGVVVVDARGPDAGALPAETGFQKFVGLEVELADDLADPGTAELIDATVPQRGGFRFVYTLPFGPRRALVEDTVFANEPDLDEAGMRAAVLAYCERRGMRVTAILREEKGVLPMPWRPTTAMRATPPLVAGYQGGWFHPATGYSVPVAARLAAFVAERPPGAVFGADLAALVREQEEQARFGYLLNELLFKATAPEKRFGVFEHFYEHPDELILRFYGLELTAADKRRMFLRRPPPGVSFLKAARVLPGWLLGRR